MRSPLPRSFRWRSFPSRPLKQSPSSDLARPLAEASLHRDSEGLEVAGEVRVHEHWGLRDGWCEPDSLRGAWEEGPTTLQVPRWFSSQDPASAPVELLRSGELFLGRVVGAAAPGLDSAMLCAWPDAQLPPAHPLPVHPSGPHTGTHPVCPLWKKKKCCSMNPALNTAGPGKPT